MSGNIDIQVEDYQKAQPDPVMKDSRMIIESINNTKRWYLKYFCKEFAGVHDIEDAFMHHADSFGFEMMGWSSSTRSWVEYRFPFPYKMRSARDCLGGIEDAIRYLEKQYNLDPTVMNRINTLGEKKEEDPEEREMGALKQHVLSRVKAERERYNRAVDDEGGERGDEASADTKR